MNTISCLCRHGGRAGAALWHDRRGASAVLFAVSLLSLLGFVGLMTDAGRGYMVRSRLSAAIDAAGLAAGRQLDPVAREADLQRFFRANFPEGYLQTAVDGPHLSVDGTGEQLTVTVDASVPTTFMRLLGFETIPLSLRAVVHRESRGAELVLVMDNTGSMRDNGKIDTMKAAAQELINILYGPHDVLEDFWVGLVPYTALVNIGTQHQDWLTGLDAASYRPTAWHGCVEARSASGRDLTDDPPSVERFHPALYPHDTDNVWPLVRDENSWQNSGTGPNLGCGPAITPLVADKATISAAISAMQPWHRGGTVTSEGLAWGWRVISPRWRGLWGGSTPADLPMDYNSDLMDKIVIILTDGENQFYDNPPAGPNGSDYTAYGRLGEGRIGVTTQSHAVAALNTRMAEVCTAMKQHGIIIYTITFQLSNTTTQQLFRNCASAPSYYFNSPTNTELRAAFRAIAAQLSNLRLAE